MSIWKEFSKKPLESTHRQVKSTKATKAQTPIKSTSCLHVISRCVGLARKNRHSFSRALSFLCSEAEEMSSLKSDTISQASEEATTGSLETKPAQYGRLGGLRRKPAAGPKELTPRHKLMLEYLVQGCSKPILCQKITRPAIIDPHSGEVLKPARHPEPGEPLTLDEAAEIAGIRKRHAKELTALPLFQREMAKAVQSLRTGAQARAMQKVIDLVSHEGQGKAADRKVQLSAAMVVLGETGNSGSQVNVTVNTQTNVSPGYIVKPPSRSTIISGTLNDDRDADDEPFVQSQDHDDV